jgi:hypothetical protein
LELHGEEESAGEADGKRVVETQMVHDINCFK